MLEIDSETLDRSLLLLAADDRPVGGLVLDGSEIAAVAVCRGRRGEGIGSALVAAAATRRQPLVAEFRRSVRPFYEALGFEITDDGTGRCRGRLPRSGDGLEE
ncbi:MAG: GNAT family N-acetyltransferase [Natronomonas sp.]